MRSFVINKKAKQISHELHKMSRLNTGSDNIVFPVIEHPTNNPKDYAIVIHDLDYEILVSPGKNLSALREFCDSYTTEQKDELEAFIDNLESPPHTDGFCTVNGEQVPRGGFKLAKFKIRLVIEGYADIKDEAWMLSNGWEL